MLGEGDGGVRMGDWGVGRGWGTWGWGGSVCGGWVCVCVGGGAGDVGVSVGCVWGGECECVEVVNVCGVCGDVGDVSPSKGHHGSYHHAAHKMPGRGPMSMGLCGAGWWVFKV